MPRKTRRTLSGALLGATAAALTVKTALAGPLGPVAAGPLDEAQKNLLNASKSATSGPIKALHDAPPALGRALVGMPPASSPQPATARAKSTDGRAPQAAAPAADRLQLDPESRTRPRGSNVRATARRLLHDAALRHGIDPKLMLAVSYWESGWDQSRVSSNGAVGLMQVEPYMADAAGPGLLGRTVDVNDPYDNADVGAAILKEDLDSYRDPVMALAAYYEGPTTLQQNGLTTDAQQYAAGILSLAAQMPD